MHLRNTLFASLIALSASSFSNVAHAQSATLAVEFGTKQPGSIDCLGEGVCGCNPIDNNMVGTKVNFSTSADQNTLILTFSLSALQNAQADQAKYFASGAYIFQSSFSLSDPMFAGLNLPANAWITPNSNSTVVIDGDQVTDYITLSYNNDNNNNYNSY